MTPFVEIDISLTGIDETARRLRALPDDVAVAARSAIDTLTRSLYDLVMENVSGKILHERSGALAGSIRMAVMEEGDLIIGRVFSEGVSYADILEEGGTTEAHLIVPVNAMVMAFAMLTMGGREGGTGGDSEELFAEAVKHPGSRVPAFMYMQQALDVIGPTAQQVVQEYINEVTDRFNMEEGVSVEEGEI